MLKHSPQTPGHWLMPVEASVFVLVKLSVCVKFPKSSVVSANSKCLSLGSILSLETGKRDKERSTSVKSMWKGIVEVIYLVWWPLGFYITKGHLTKEFYFTPRDLNSWGSMEFLVSALNIRPSEWHLDPYHCSAWSGLWYSFCCCYCCLFTSLIRPSFPSSLWKKAGCPHMYGWVVSAPCPLEWFSLLCFRLTSGGHVGLATAPQPSW